MGKGPMPAAGSADKRFVRGGAKGKPFCSAFNSTGGCRKPAGKCPHEHRCSTCRSEKHNAMSHGRWAAA
ncbi:uncharacterized protein SCHCODRAFT_02632441 [Schizophyllum commune H4-8]|uniref:uncharacterized protein n=1 Tax=Schizophyllum commune (strain H4-8 / FGSC 9210) TaxID=578458 RepID=UPI00215E1C71|nr:uncharacterized protein SCHCODRAFT_02632441 [Schizophyllum commune H4-8]KAI5890633.1 hypothetical protein SCHCODRAFT_02632441 [Schizophyllum commune H4-8]